MEQRNSVTVSDIKKRYVYARSPDTKHLYILDTYLPYKDMIIVKVERSANHYNPCDLMVNLVGNYNEDFEMYTQTIKEYCNN